MTTSNKSLYEELLAQTPESMAVRAKRVELLEPAAWESEQLLLQAILQQPHEESEELAQREMSSVWKALWNLVLRSPVQWATAMVLICATGMWMAIPETVTTPKRSQHRLLPKGGNQAKARQGVALQIGLWQADKKRIEPLRPKQVLESKQSIVFGIKVSKYKGYIHLFHRRSNGIEQIYPTPGMLPQFRQAKEGVQLLRSQGRPQRYTLDGERGTQHFIVLLAKRALTENEVGRWKRLLSRTHRVRKSMGQRPHAQVQKSLSKANIQQLLHASDLFELYVKGQRP